MTPSFPTTVLFAALALSSMRNANAQDPTSVDIDLRRSTVDTNNLEVRLRANDQSFGDVLSGLTFTVRWETTSPATLGTAILACQSGIPIAPTPQETNPVVDEVPTGYNYVTYNAFGFTLLSSFGCTLPPNGWDLVLTIPVEGSTGCDVFQIVNDGFTHAPGNARDYFVSLGGIDKTGIIEDAAAVFGACLPDCEGVVGGSAQPGSPCDDLDPDTENDVYSEECVCAGVALGLADTGAPTVLSLWPNPTSGIVHMSASRTDATTSVVRVSDALGRIIHAPITRSLNNSTVRSIDLSTVPSGLYMIEIDLDGERRVERIVKR